jgi:hypothetical protein
MERTRGADGGRIEERSLHSTSRLLRTSEAEKKERRPVPVGMTGVAGGATGAKIIPIATKLVASRTGVAAKSPAAAKKNSAKALGAKKSGAGKKRTAKKGSGAKRRSGIVQRG